MKTKNNFLIVLSLLLAPFFMEGQVAKAEATVSHSSDAWKPLALYKNRSNVKEGVEFYKMDIDCESDKVTIIKMINKNNYAVEIKYEGNSFVSARSIDVPSLRSVEGACGATGNAANLVIKRGKNQPSGVQEELGGHIQVIKK
ncbi:MAG: hypothetical protein JST67_08165 [Bacteroidetes bacterium]|nr:hypothetical protein [Bacteroidota bacterium]